MHETWHRVIKMYERESPEQYVDLKKLWHSYQNRKREVVSQYEAVKNAQNVTVDSIPLPSGDMSGTGDFERRSPISSSHSLAINLIKYWGKKLCSICFYV